MGDRLFRISKGQETIPKVMWTSTWFPLAMPALARVFRALSAPAASPASALRSAPPATAPAARAQPNACQVSDAGLPQSRFPASKHCLHLETNPNVRVIRITWGQGTAAAAWQPAASSRLPTRQPPLALQLCSLELQTPQRPLVQLAGAWKFALFCGCDLARALWAERHLCIMTRVSAKGGIITQRARGF